MQNTNQKTSALVSLSPVLSSLHHTLQKQLLSVVLFGSRARGEPHQESDWDLLVIANKLPLSPFQRHIYLKKLLPDEWRGVVSILAKTPDEFESHLSDLFLDIALDGVILHDTNHYMKDHLTRIRHLIQKHGLHREQVENNFIWHWQKFPGYNWSLELEISQ